MMKISCWILFPLILLSCSIKKASDHQSLTKKDAQLIDYLFSDCKSDQAGASVLVIKKGKVVHNNCYGLANVGENINTSPKSNYRIASVSKQFTAMAILILIKQGKLDFETKLTEIFPAFPNYGQAIHVRHLMTHQSGLLDYDGFFDDNRVKQVLDHEVLEQLMTVDSSYFVPGSNYRYSNSGYAVLAKIVEKISGNTFADFMAKEVFQKLDMKTTTVFELDSPIANRAFGYKLEQDSVIFNDQSLFSAIQGDGGIYCSTMDYYKWDQALYTDKLLPQEMLEDAFSDWDGDVRTDKEGYGYGWSVKYPNGKKELNHSGGTAGFESQVIRVPSQELSVVLFTNRHWKGRNLWYKAKALTSIYSDYNIPMPIEILVKKEIEQKGMAQGLQLYDQLKQHPHYEVQEATLSHLGMTYYRNDQLQKAKALFNKAKVEGPDYFGGYFCTGLLSKKEGDIETAISNFEKVIELGTREEEWILDRAKTELEKLTEKKALPSKE